jgi:hypothetical protein
MKKTLLLIVVAASAFMMGCASKPEPIGGENCVVPVTRDIGQGVRITGCSAWVFGPSRTQAANFKHRRMPSPYTAPRL